MLGPPDLIRRAGFKNAHTLDQELPLGFNMKTDVKQRNEAIQRIKKHEPGFHIVGLKKDGARQKTISTYRQLRTDLVATIVATLPLEDSVAVAAYNFVAWYHDLSR